MSRAVAFQDISFFKNGSVFSDTPSVTLVTSTFETSPSWLVHSLLSSVLGKPKNNDNANTAASRQSIQHVVLISFVDKSPLYSRVLLKSGINLTTNSQPISSSHSAPFTWIDLSADLASDLPTLRAKIHQQIGNRPPESTLIIFENPDLLIPLSTVSPNEILELCGSLQSKCASLYFVVNADEELLASANDDGSGSLEASQSTLVLGLLYRSTVSLAVRPLSTGRARDVTGVLRISKGPMSTSDTVAEQSYQFFVSGDNVKLSYR